MTDDYNDMELMMVTALNIVYAHVSCVAVLLKIASVQLRAERTQRRSTVVA